MNQRELQPLLNGDFDSKPCGELPCHNNSRQSVRLFRIFTWDHLTQFIENFFHAEREQRVGSFFAFPHRDLQTHGCKARPFRPIRTGVRVEWASSYIRSVSRYRCTKEVHVLERICKTGAPSVGKRCECSEIAGRDAEFDLLQVAQETIKAIDRWSAELMKNRKLRTQVSTLDFRNLKLWKQTGSEHSCAYELFSNAAPLLRHRQHNRHYHSSDRPYCRSNIPKVFGRADPLSDDVPNEESCERQQSYQQADKPDLNDLPCSLHVALRSQSDEIVA